MDSYHSQIRNRFTFRAQIYCFVELLASWYCSKEAKRTHPCIIIVILLFQTSFIEWQRRNMNQGNTQLFLSCAFLFFLCLIHCKSEKHPFECKQQRQRETETEGSSVGTFLSCSTGKPSLFDLANQKCMFIQFNSIIHFWLSVYSYFTPNPGQNMNPSILSIPIFLFPTLLSTTTTKTKVIKKEFPSLALWCITCTTMVTISLPSIKKTKKAYPLCRVHLPAPPLPVFTGSIHFQWLWEKFSHQLPRLVFKFNTNISVETLNRQRLQHSLTYPWWC